MEIRIYDRDLNFVGLVENQRSFIWTRRYFEPGSFELHVPITDYTISLFQMGRLVSYAGAGDAGVIEELELEESALHNEIIAKGRFLASYMDRRLIRGTLNFNGRVEVAMRKILSDATPLPLVQLGTLKGYTDTIQFQATYKNVLDYEQKLSQSANIGFHFVPDFTNKTITFELYKGVDRSRAQTERAFVEFSEEFDNINSVNYYTNETLFKTNAWVGGQGEGSARRIVAIGDSSLTGLDRREMFIDARDLSPDDLTDAEYVAVLSQRGHDVMRDYPKTTTFECTTEANLNFKYRQDYDLGDIVTIRKKLWQVTANLRITEIMEVYEHGKMQVIPTFGTPLATKIDWEDY